MLLLLPRIGSIEVAQARGPSEIFGDVLCENAPMLLLAREFGFAVTPHRDEAEVVRESRAFACS